MEKEIRFKAYLSSKGNNKHRKLYNFYKSIGTLKQLAYSDFIKGMIKKKHNFRKLFGFQLTNFKKKYICDDSE